MPDVAHAGVGQLDGAGLLLGLSQEVLDGVPAGVSADDDGGRLAVDDADGIKGVAGGLGGSQAQQRQRDQVHGAGAQGVAVSGGVQSLGQAHGTGAAGLILHIDGLAEGVLAALGQDPQGQVRTAACAVGADNGHGFGGEGGGIRIVVIAGLAAAGHQRKNHHRGKNQGLL